MLTVGRCKLPLNILDSGNDEEGRVAYVKTMLGNYKIAFISVYAPNSHDQNFFDSLTLTLLDLSGFSLIVGVDFNGVWEHQRDRTGLNELREQQLTSSSLQRWAGDVSVIDSWRLVNPSFRDYSFYSARHKSFSRIDYIFISKDLAGKVRDSLHIPITFSDHNAVLSQINIPLEIPRAARWRFNSSLLQNEQFITHMNIELSEFIGFNKG